MFVLTIFFSMIDSLVIRIRQKLIFFLEEPSTFPLLILKDWVFKMSSIVFTRKTPLIACILLIEILCSLHETCLINYVIARLFNYNKLGFKHFRHRNHEFFLFYFKYYLAHISPKLIQWCLKHSAYLFINQIVTIRFKRKIKFETFFFYKSNSLPSLGFLSNCLTTNILIISKENV